MASPFQVATLGNVSGLPYSPQSRVAYLHDGSLLVAVNTGTGTVSLYQSTNPGATTPTFSVLSQTFAITSATAVPADLLVIPGSGTSDIWLCYASNGGSGSQVLVAHATYNGSSFTWDNTGTAAVSPVNINNSQTASIAWNGTDLIVCYRDRNVGATAWFVQCTYTATKAGGSGWQTPFTISTTTSGGASASHQHPILLHDALLAGGTTGATICLYTINNGTSTGNEQWAARVLLDSAANAGSANWGAEVKNTSVTGQNIGAAAIAACVDTANGNVHTVWASSVAGTGGATGVSYVQVSTTSGGTPSFGSRVTVDTTSGSGTVGCGVDVRSRLYVFFSTGAIGSAGVVDYRTADSPYSSFSSSSTTVANTAGDGFPHLPSKGVGQAVSGYVPLLYQHGTSSFTAQYDNTISAQTLSAALTATTLVDTSGSTATPSVAIAMTASTVVDTSGSTAQLLGPIALTATTSVTTAASATMTIATIVNFTASTAVVTTASATTTSRGLTISTQTQTGISGGPPGNNTTETDVSNLDASGNGVRWGFIPAYGGGGGVPWYEVNANVQSVPQTNLGTSKANSNFHIYSHVGASFLASEDPTYTLTELSTAAAHGARAYFDSGTSAQDANGFTWRERTAIFPLSATDMLVCMRIDAVNASSVTTATTDSYEVTELSGLTQVTQGGAIAWSLANSGWGFVGGSQTSPIPSGLTASTEPDYLWSIPSGSSSVTTGIVSVPKQTANSVFGTTAAGVNNQSNTTRLKVYLQSDRATATPAGTHTWYQYLVYRRGLTSSEAASIAADIRNPDASSIVSVGTPAGTFYDPDEAAYVIGASSNQVSLTHTFPTNVTERWHLAYKLTGWTVSAQPSVSVGSVGLNPGVDYVSAVDLANQVCYVVLLRPIVASGATGSQLNNGLMVISGTGASSIPLTASTAVVTGGLATPSLALPVTGSTSITTTAVASGPLEAIALTAATAVVSTASSTVSVADAMTATAAILIGGQALPGVAVAASSSTSVVTGGSAALGVVVALTASTSVTTTSAATASVADALTASTQIVIGGQANISTPGALTAQGSVPTTATAIPSVAIALTAQTAVVTGGAPAITDAIALTAQTTVVTTALASLTGMVGVASVVTGGSAALSVAVAMTAQTSVITGVSAVLSTPGAMTAATSVVTSASANSPTTPIAMTAATSVLTTGSASLVQPIVLTAATSVVVGGAAQPTVAVASSATTAVLTSATASVGQTIAFTASTAVTTSASVALAQAGVLTATTGVAIGGQAIPSMSLPLTASTAVTTSSTAAYALQMAMLSTGSVTTSAQAVMSLSVLTQMTASTQVTTSAQTSLAVAIALTAQGRVTVTPGQIALALGVIQMSGSTAVVTTALASLAIINNVGPYAVSASDIVPTNRIVHTFEENPVATPLGQPVTGVFTINSATTGLPYSPTTVTATVGPVGGSYVPLPVTPMPNQPGQYSYTTPSTYQAGPWSIRIRGRDAGGNLVATLDVEFAVNPSPQPV